MTTPQQVAAKYNLKTADTLPPKSKGPSTRATRWSPEKRAMFQDMGWAAVYIAGNLEGPEPRYFGDNMGAWPILLGITGSWEDNVSRNMDRMSVFKQRGMLFRAWTPSIQHAQHLLGFIEGYLKERIDQGLIDRLRGPWLDFGPDTDLGEFEREIHALAARKGITSMTDEDFSEEVDRRVREENSRLTDRRR